jgi:integrase/recombinase XerD
VCMDTSADIDVACDSDDFVLQLASAGYLGRHAGTSPVHCSSDLCLYFTWCREHQASPLTIDPGRDQAPPRVDS